MTCKDCLHYEACNKFIWREMMLLESVADFVCGDYKDKSRFVELPCKAGDKIFMIVGDIDAGTAFVDEGKVISVIYECTGVWISARYECGLFYHHKFGSGDYFFTIAEAEKALAERKEK